ncbi:type II toxin-antitoxin system PemK/MazF family toxin [uncultured Gemella sp.]|uniref:type II toxin-antitoxin system PemK/MazF family toxin n=1 Tax=uncultured Gemella sp. TaxID=254352 RepID=UPI0025DFCE4A|nr:type II toxin-antitoxin system PemK/MazF family toxin [uncultured Gemella sp.]
MKNKKQENEELLAESTDKMKEITVDNPNHFKTSRLGKSMKNYTTQLERDVLGIRRRNPVYPRGTLVYVDFGINYGSEFSSYHYAITLSNEDNRKENTITVVPLTSKKGKRNIKLNSSVSTSLAALTLMLVNEHSKVIEITNNKSKETIDELREQSKIAREKQDIEKTIEINEKLDELAKLYEQIKMVQEASTTALKRVEKYTEDLDKDTYIKVDAITTIDKNKIFKRKDDLDPLTRVTVSEDILKLIDNEIKNLFLTKD